MKDGFSTGLNRIIMQSPVVLMGGRAGGEFLVDFVTENISRFGYRPEDIAGRDLAVESLVFEEDRPGVELALEACASSGASECVLEYRLKTPSGGIVPVQENRVFHACRDGEARTWQSALMDVTDRKTAEEEAGSLGGNLARTLDAFRIGAFEYSFERDDYTISGFRPQGGGLSGGEAVPRENMAAAFPDLPQLPDEAFWRKLFDEAEGGVELERGLQPPGGDARLFSIKAFPWKDGKGAITGAAGIITDITPLKAARDRVLAQGRRLELLRSLSMKMMAELDTEELLKIILISAVEFAGAGHGVINLLEDDGRAFRRKFAVGLFEPMKGETRPAGSGITAKALREKRRIFLKNYAESPDKLNEPRFDGIVSSIVMPLYYGARDFGGLTVSYTSESPDLDEDFAASLDQFASIASLALENARLHEIAGRELRNKAIAEERLKAQNRISAASAEASGYLLARGDEGALDRALLVIGEAAGAKRAVLFRDVPEKGLAEVLGRGVRPEGPDLPLPYGPAERKAYPRVFECLARGQVFRGELDGGEGSVVAVPVYMGSRFWGFLSLVYAGPPPHFSSAGLNGLRAAAYNLAVSASGLDADRQVKAGYVRLQKTFEDVIGAIGFIVGKKDPYTIEHQRRVSALARDAGELMGLDPFRLEGLRVAGLIHDVGKAEIPGEILSKPGKLSAAEYGLVKTHARAGFEILSGIDFPWPVANIVLQHHERLDGSGYPGGLAGDEIMEEARILAVADVAEAMASHRPYRPSLGADAALDEIMGKRGILYDVRAVDAVTEALMKAGLR